MRVRDQMIPINVLNDDVLLAIFDIFVAGDEYQDTKREVEAWQSLVHVCRRWRILVFESPRRLNLQLCCRPKTPTKDTLDIWPPLPLVVRCNRHNIAESGTRNIIAALGHSNRVSQVILTDLGWYLDEVLAAMLVPFPELTYLRLVEYRGTPFVIPDSFLCESAPRLQHVHLNGIPFPGLPKLLLSASHLVYLRLWNIPRSGYISSEEMGALISGLSSLEALSLEFKSPESCPDWESRSPPLLERSILPALDTFHYKGDTKYLEDLVTFIDAPQLHYFYTNFFPQIDFDTPRLAQFINRTPTLRALDEARVQFDYSTARVALQAGSRTLSLSTICGGSDWQFRSIEQICNSLHSLSTVEDLYIEHQYLRLNWENDGMENTLWLGLLLPFTAVKNLYLSEEFASGIAGALQELIGGRITEVLPSLQNIFVEGLEPSGPFRENIGQFVAARYLSGHPIAISVWAKDSKMKPKK